MLAAACSDVISLATGRARSELAVLLLQSAAPAPAGIQFFVANSRTMTRNILHPDQFNNLFLRATFPAGSLAMVAGQAASTTDSVLVTIQPVAGTFGFDLGAAGVTFSTSAQPSVSLFFGSYGDFARSRAGSRYASNTEFAQALTLWREGSLDRFTQVTGSGPAGTDAVAGSLQGPGSYLVAAPK